jgi:diaminobutyrate-2-oxoglutarate transaminase
MRKTAVVRERLEQIASCWRTDVSVRGRGLIQGLACGLPGVAERISRRAFERGLLLETAGARSEVVKLLPALTISDQELEEGLDILEQCSLEVFDGARASQPAA